MFGEQKYVSYDPDLKGLSYDSPFGVITFRGGMHYMWRLFSFFTLTGMTIRN